MSEEMNQNLSPAPEGDKKEETKETAHRQNSVFRYLAILFGAAFLLLLFTFISERRQNQLLLHENEVQIDSLQQSSNSAVQSLENLYEQNDALKAKVKELEEQLQAAETQRKETADNSAKTLAALDWFWQLDEAFVKGDRKALCRRLIARMEEEGLVEFLPAESATNNGRFSPAQRYQEIYDALF